MRLKLFVALVLGGLALATGCLAQQTVTVDPYMAVLDGLKDVVPGKAATLDVFVMDATSMEPSKGLTITASLTMPAMADMALAIPKVTPGAKPGHYDVQLTLPHAGEYRLDLKVKAASDKVVTLSFKISPANDKGGDMKDLRGMPGMKDMPGMSMKGTFGNWPPNREGSGTSWQPDASPMFMKSLPAFGGFEVSLMGIVEGGYVDAGGKRGDKGLFSNSMLMFMGRKETGGGTLGLHFMTSLDGYINGRRGVPNLFQNSFDVNGQSVGDRKDPHNLFSELAISFSHPLSKDWSGLAYGGPVGEPALGNVMYFHRPSGLEIPEAPISHDWFDGTHISFGVATLGLVYQNRWKLEGSAFNGHDPTNLFGIGPVALNSASGRLSFNPNQNWSFSSSYGYINADVNEHRFTLGSAYSLDLPRSDNFSATAYFGQNIVKGSANSNAWLAEGTYYHGQEAIFARFERVDKDDLVNVPPGTFTINKLLVGDVHSFCRKDQLDFGLGIYAGVYAFPSSLNAIYGRNPLTFGVFLRIRPGKG